MALRGKTIPYEAGGGPRLRGSLNSPGIAAIVVLLRSLEESGIGQAHLETMFRQVEARASTGRALDVELLIVAAGREIGSLSNGVLGP
jgi:hypothetical protein